jgi:malate synthase A
MTADRISQSPFATPPGVKLRGAVPEELAFVLAPGALELAADLERRFGARRERLLARRLAVQRRLDRGWLPAFAERTATIRGAGWKVAPPPADLLDRRVEITGPPERKMVINAMNSGAKVFMADFEDSCSPTWHNLLDGQRNLFDAVRRTIEHRSPDGKQYRLDEKTATLVVRPRGWHMLETRVLVDARPMSASLFDFAIYLWHNAVELVRRGSGAYFYLPKMESRLEARLWNEVFLFAEERLALPRGTIRATVLVETILAAFEMDEILWELREHSTGLNCGRWDYIFSFIKRFREHAGYVMPDRQSVGMDRAFLAAYSALLIQVCHRRGAHAMGGMAAQIPIKGDETKNAAALAKVRADKRREAEAGHDGTWVAHPGLVAIAREEFDRVMPAPHQMGNLRTDVRTRASDLLAVPSGTITDQGLRTNLEVGVRYLAAWLSGTGCVPIHHLMEDAATAEISRVQVWQWIRHGARLEDGRAIDRALVRRTLEEEMADLRSELGPERMAGGRFEEAAGLFEALVTRPELEEFLTLAAQDRLEPTITSPNPPPNMKDNRFPHSGDLFERTRFEGIVRDFTPADVERLRGSLRIEHTLADVGARRLWKLLHEEEYVAALGALTGNQAMQMVKAGLKAIYLSGWQVAADANLSGHMYPDQSLYPANSVPAVVKRINQCLQRADQISHMEGDDSVHWFAPIVADAEAGFGGPLNAFELMKAMIEAGAAGVHFEDQLASEKKCGHLGGKVLVPTQTFVRTLTAARLAADVMGVPTLIIARTDADAASLITSDVDERDRAFLTGERTSEGFFRVRPGIEQAIARALSYAPYADLVWCETSTPDLAEARHFAEAVHARFPGKLLAYNCSPSFNWKRKLDDATIARFQRELGAMGYKFQFVTLAGFHSLNHGMFELARDYGRRGMAAYCELQTAEFASEAHGYSATKHQREVGTGYFDAVAQAVAGGNSSTTALAGSTEAQQFGGHAA